MKHFFDPLAASWTSLTTHKLRSFLTILGVVIGVGAVIILMSVGRGTEATILNNLSGLGTNLIYVTPGSTTQGGVRGAQGSASTLTYEDAVAIAQNVANIIVVAPSSNSNMQAVAGNQNQNVRVTGVTPEYQEVFKLQLTEGYFITQDQSDRSLKVALLGSTVATNLFGQNDPVDQKIRMGNNNFTVIGVLKTAGQSISSTDNTILIPLSTLQGLVARSITTTGQHVVNTINVLAISQDQISTVKADISGLLETRHKIPADGQDDFTVTSLDQIVSTVTQSANSITLLLGAIAGISLVVGGIGVMNIMLVSVMERRREIGIRKALGAQGRDIWGQFLIDSAFLTFTGGIIGVAIGWGGSYLLARTGTVTTLVSPDIVILAVGVSVGIGLFFGFYPAWQGSRLDPIQALRAE